MKNLKIILSALLISYGVNASEVIELDVNMENDPNILAKNALVAISDDLPATDKFTAVRTLYSIVDEFNIQGYESKIRDFLISIYTFLETQEHALKNTIYKLAEEFWKKTLRIYYLKIATKQSSYSADRLIDIDSSIWFIKTFNIQDGELTKFHHLHNLARCIYDANNSQDHPIKRYNAIETLGKHGEDFLIPDAAEIYISFSKISNRHPEEKFKAIDKARKFGKDFSKEEVAIYLEIALKLNINVVHRFKALDRLLKVIEEFGIQNLGSAIFDAYYLIACNVHLEKDKRLIALNRLYTIGVKFGIQDYETQIEPVLNSIKQLKIKKE